MATSPRTKTPNDAALSAVEEALRLDFGGPEEEADAENAALARSDQRRERRPEPSRAGDVSRPSGEPVRRGELLRRPEAPRTPAPPRRGEPPPRRFEEPRRAEAPRPEETRRPEPARAYEDEAPPPP